MWSTWVGLVGGWTQGVVNRWLSRWWYDWFVGNGCMISYVCCVSGSCVWWFMMLVVASLTWNSCVVEVLGTGMVLYWPRYYVYLSLCLSMRWWVVSGS